MNERLRSALAQSGLSVEALAEFCAVDPKTVGRWLAGRLPHRRHRFATAQRLGVDETYLWPEDRQRTSQAASNTRPDITDIYPNRASVPRDVWLTLLLGAVKHIDILVFSGTFLAQTNPHIARMLRERAEAGAKVRLCFGDPGGQAVAVRGWEEGIGDTLAAKIRASLTYYRSLVDAPGCEVRLHDVAVYSSLFRYDNQLLVNPHLWGQPASANPLFRLSRTPDSDFFERYMESFEAVWNIARPWAPEEQEPHRRGQD
ncbi:XRE family transcriptional regulator [Streptomyces aidingensis]|uniref:XRE family transcriptional regulator n=1 Tax=Streptomyces aidingensis TaxID=910347 RepID=UPI001587D54B|nr:XRE family transcriptional regulator [Streptomyces aidingensis]